METTLSTLAQVFVGPLVGTISDYYGPALLQKIGMKWDVTEEMEKLSVILLTIKVVLEDAEEKQVTNDLIRKWLRELKDVAYDVEDLLDVCATEALHDPESTGIINGAVKPAMVDRFKRFINKFCFPKKRKFITKFEDIKRIKQLINKFEEIAEQRSKFNLINHTSTTRVVDCRVDPRRETSSFPTELKVYGRDEEKECIVNLMVNNINAENLSFYAIVGIGGLGKTTLAQMVYNDNMVESRFEIRRWVCVSENFEVKSLIGDIIQSGSNNNSQTLDQLQCNLQNILRGKRFLLILDDVWNEDEAKWERLKSSLSCGANGSSIIVTTRSDKVASLMGILHVCHPKMLSEEDCFSLFKHRAFAEGEEERYPNLESIGKQIVKKCGGVPLAAKALGGLLRFKREENEWLFVKESKLWDLPQDKEDSILPALRLSYKHLPQHLRQCFVYCSIFPKDYKIIKEVLIQLWMANGFLQPEGNMELEDIGNGIFNDLIWRGFFQEVCIDDFANTECKMHDLVHDLACSITRDECFSVVSIGDEELVARSCNTTRHLVVNADILFSPNFSLSMFQSFLRTLFLLDESNSYVDVPLSLNFSNLIYLRVLDLSCTKRLETLPESVGKLKLLRYLDLSRTRIALLSDEVFGNLINLQTLKLIDCDNLEMLPGNMRKLTNLRHLDITGSTLLGMPVGMGQLKSLHKLSHFIVSEDSGCGVGELQELDHLGGKLELTCLGKVKDVRDAENAKLSRKENIRALGLDWLIDDDYLIDDDLIDDDFQQLTNSVNANLIVDDLQQLTNSRNVNLIADALQPHHNLERLVFCNYDGSDFPRWMKSTCLFSLVELELFECSKCKHLPTLGLLPHLKKLNLRDIPHLECIGNEFYCDEEEGNNIMKAARGMVLFPALEQLELYVMRSLEEWKGWSSSSRMKEGEAQVSVFPVLKTLRIGNCPSLSTIPPLPIEYLDLEGSNEKILERSLENLTALQSLKIVFFPKLVSLPEGVSQNLASLKSLIINRCNGLKSLNKCLRHLTNLHELEIRNCPALELLPDDFQNLVSLRSLLLDGLPKLVAVPVLGSTLEIISFRTCAGLTNLPEWITNLKSLQVLNLYECKNLKSLPEGLQHLTALGNLYIIDCHPELHRRCQKYTGEDWHKIATFRTISTTRHIVL